MSLISFYKSTDTFYAEMTSALKDVDTSNHSLVYNTLRPSASENSNQTLMLDEALKMVFPELAYQNGYDDYLDMWVDAFGIERKQSTYAVGIIKVTGVIGYSLPAGTTVSTPEGITFTTNSNLTLTDTIGYVNVTATNTGSIYNVSAGKITVLPVSYTGITSITNEVATTGGIDRETNEELYDRVQEKLQDDAGSGNNADYKKWCLEVDGVGYVKVYGLKDSSFNDVNGCVTCVVAKSDKTPVDSTIITNVENFIATVAPIGATLYVLTTEELALNIVINGLVELDNYSLDNVKTNISNALNTYLNNLDSDISIISYNQILGTISNATGVKDITDITLNGGTTNITLTNLQVPTLGMVTYS